MKEERPLFFCDNCGEPVSPGIPVCPHCGSEFSGVRCPSCGYSGSAGEFKNGCPSCGYLNTAENRQASDEIRLPDWVFRAGIIFLLIVLAGFMFLFGTRIF